MLLIVAQGSDEGYPCDSLATASCLLKATMNFGMMGSALGGSNMGGLPMGWCGHGTGGLGRGNGVGGAQFMQGNAVPAIPGGRGTGNQGVPFMFPMMFQPSGLLGPPWMQGVGYPEFSRPTGGW